MLVTPSEEVATSGYGTPDVTVAAAKGGHKVCIIEVAYSQDPKNAFEKAINRATGNCGALVVLVKPIRRNKPQTNTITEEAKSFVRTLLAGKRPDKGIPGIVDSDLEEYLQSQTLDAYRQHIETIVTEDERATKRAKLVHEGAGEGNENENEEKSEREEKGQEKKGSEEKEREEKERVENEPKKDPAPGSIHATFKNSCSLYGYQVWDGISRFCLFHISADNCRKVSQGTDITVKVSFSPPFDFLCILLPPPGMAMVWCRPAVRQPHGEGEPSSHSHCRMPS